MLFTPRKLQHHAGHLDACKPGGLSVLSTAHDASNVRFPGTCPGWFRSAPGRSQALSQGRCATPQSLRLVPIATPVVSMVAAVPITAEVQINAGAGIAIVIAAAANAIAIPLVAMAVAAAAVIAVHLFDGRLGPRCLWR